MFDFVADPACENAVPMMPTGHPGQFHKLKSSDMIVRIIAQAPVPHGTVHDATVIEFSLWWWIVDAIDPERKIMPQVEDASLEPALSEMEVLAWASKI